MIKLILSCLCLVLLAGCGAKVDDLEAFTAQIKQTTQISIEPYPEFNQLETVEYTASEFRSPFQKAVASPDDQPELVNNTNCLQPQRGRKKSPLESYGLDALRMAGVFASNGQKWALIKANDGTLHKVRAGQYIGLFNGLVKTIDSAQIVIQEMLPDGAGCWKQKTATMNMASVIGESDNV